MTRISPETSDAAQKHKIARNLIIRCGRLGDPVTFDSVSCPLDLRRRRSRPTTSGRPIALSPSVRLGFRNGLQAVRDMVRVGLSLSPNAATMGRALPPVKFMRTPPGPGLGVGTGPLPDCSCGCELEGGCWAQTGTSREHGRRRNTLRAHPPARFKHNIAGDGGCGLATRARTRAFVCVLARVRTHAVTLPV